MKLVFKILLSIFFNLCAWRTIAGYKENEKESQISKTSLNRGEYYKHSSSVSNTQLKNLVNDFAITLQNISNYELGVSLVQNLINAFEYKLVNDDEMKLVKRLAERLERKVKGYLTLLNYSISLIKHFKQHSVGKLCYVHVPCIYVSVNKSHGPSLEPPSFLNVTEGFMPNPELGLQKYTPFFISEMEEERLTQIFSKHFENDYCRVTDNLHFQRLFVKTVSQDQKQLVLLLDNGGPISENHFSIGKALAIHIIQSLSPEDRVNFFAVSQTVVSVDPQCTMAHATVTTKHNIIAFIENLTQETGRANHTLGFVNALKVIQHSLRNGSSDTALIVYISRGLTTTVLDAQTVMEAISHIVANISTTVQINTCAPIDNEKTILFDHAWLDKHFLSVVATKTRNVTPGIFMMVNPSSSLGPMARSLLFSNRTNNRPVFFPPQWDVNNKGQVVISISKVVEDQQGQLIGVIGIDIPVEDLSEDIQFFNSEKDSYSFLIDLRGMTLAHPLLQQPHSPLYSPPVSEDITSFETSTFFSEIKGIVLRNNSGMVKHDKITYRWQHVLDSPYIVVVINRGFHQSVQWPSRAMLPSVPLVYHRLDLTRPRHHALCRNYRQLSSLDAGSVFLSARCFQSPTNYLLSEHNTSKMVVQSYMAYLKDSTLLLANPGLHSFVRAHLVSVHPIISYWKQLNSHSNLAKYIIRRYIVSSGGAVLMYPAGVMDHRIDILKRHWYVRAQQNSGQITLSPPYLDAAGAGYVVTLSVAVGEYPLFFVLALDFSLGAIFKFIMEAIPQCSSGLDDETCNVKCFMMEDRGYLVSHPSLLRDADNHQQQHITHLESLVANDLLNHKGIVKKLVCNDFASNTLQRWYQFNLSTNQVVTNMIYGDQCVRYQLTALPGTNVFLGVVNTTCDLVTAFCPCNMMDQHCLNCNRMEQNECECPCECPLMSDCNESAVAAEPCTPTGHSGLYVPDHVLKLLAAVDNCHQPHCDQLTTYRSCVGVVGCEWCQFQNDGVTPLTTPFCAQQDICFNGVSSARLYEGVPVISISGIIFALLIALTIMFYCCCKNSGRQIRIPEPSYHMHMFNTDNNITEEPPTGPNNRLVSNAQELNVALLGPASSISPYRISTDYRRPPAGDSDHGYSTMTAQEDTEPPQSPSPPTLLYQTVLPHRFITPVKVHMAMDT